MTHLACERGNYQRNSCVQHPKQIVKKKMLESNPTFMMINAFTKTVTGGNPAAVVLLHKDWPSKLRQEIAKNFNQPISAFVVPFEVGDGEQENTFKLFFHTPKTERDMCGHGILAAAHAVFSMPGMVSGDIVTFLTKSERTLAARRLEMGPVEIVLPSTTVNEVSKDESCRIQGVLKKAFGRELVPLFVGKGGKGFEDYLLVEVDAQENLGDAMVDAQAFVGTLPYRINITTAAGSPPGALFASRVFAPTEGVDEDPVCGSAHCLLTPYWTGKANFVGKQVAAIQLSERGGEIQTSWMAAEGVVTLQGDLRTVAQGLVFT